MNQSQDIALSVSRCHHCAIRHHAVCGALSEEELVELNKIAHQKSYKAGDLIVSDTEEVDFFGNIISGVVKLSKTMDDGRQQIVGLLFSPDFWVGLIDCNIHILRKLLQMLLYAVFLIMPLKHS